MTWQRLPADLQKLTESALRSVAAKRIERAAATITENRDADFVVAFAGWTEMMQTLKVKNIRFAPVSQIVTEVQRPK